VDPWTFVKRHAMENLNVLISIEWAILAPFIKEPSGWEVTRVASLTARVSARRKLKSCIIVNEVRL